MADNSNWYLWTVTSRDASGRLEGELFGNGMNTKRVFDPYTGDLLAIETGVAKKQQFPAIIKNLYNQPLQKSPTVQYCASEKASVTSTGFVTAS